MSLAESDARSFTDVLGNNWVVWEVYPRLTERRLLRERRLARRGTLDRRHEVVGRQTLPRQILAGWLAFQNLAERRRLAPVPDDWEDLSDRELRALLAQSTLSSRPRAARQAAPPRNSGSPETTERSHTISKGATGSK
ncbi:MAG: hypothetical protein ABJE10_16990 [bacterium]